MKTTQAGASSPLIEAIKEHGTWFTISMVGLVLIFGLTLVNDPSKWWIGLLVAVGISVFLFTAANGRVVLKAIGSIFVLLLCVTASSNIGMLVATVPLFGFTWPLYQLGSYLFALALSYMLYSGRGRWTYLGLMTIAQFLLTTFLIVINANPNLSVVVGMSVGILGFTAAYLLNGRTRVASSMPTSSFSEDFLKSVVKGAAELELTTRIVPARKGLAPHLLVYSQEKSIILYPIELEQHFSAIGRRMNKLGYKGKDINAWLLKLVFHTSPSWKARAASPVLVLVDTKRKNGKEGKLIGVSLPDSKRKAVVGIQPAPPLTADFPKNGAKLLRQSFKLVAEYTQELTVKQYEALNKVGLSPEDVAELNNTEDGNTTETVSTTRTENSGAISNSKTKNVKTEE